MKIEWYWRPGDGGSSDLRRIKAAGSTAEEWATLGARAVRKRRNLQSCGGIRADVSGAASSVTLAVLGTSFRGRIIKHISMKKLARICSLSSLRQQARTYQSPATLVYGKRTQRPRARKHGDKQRAWRASACSIKACGRGTSRCVYLRMIAHRVTRVKRLAPRVPGSVTTQLACRALVIGTANNARVIFGILSSPWCWYGCSFLRGALWWIFAPRALRNRGGYRIVKTCNQRRSVNRRRRCGGGTFDRRRRIDIVAFGDSRVRYRRLVTWLAPRASRSTCILTCLRCGASPRKQTLAEQRNIVVHILTRLLCAHDIAQQNIKQTGACCCTRASAPPS